MRELSKQEVDQVSGGLFPLAMLAGAAVSGVSSHLNGHSLSTSLGAAVIGGLGGGAGAMARLSTGFVRYAWAARATGLQVTAGVASDSVSAGTGGGGAAQMATVLEAESE